MLDWKDRDLVVHTSRTKRSADFITLLGELDHAMDRSPAARPNDRSCWSWTTARFTPERQPERQTLPQGDGYNSSAKCVEFSSLVTSSGA